MGFREYLGVHFQSSCLCGTFFSNDLLHSKMGKKTYYMVTDLETGEVISFNGCLVEEPDLKGVISDAGLEREEALNLV